MSYRYDRDAYYHQGAYGRAPLRSPALTAFVPPSQSSRLALPAKEKYDGPTSPLSLEDDYFQARNVSRAPLTGRGVNAGSIRKEQSPRSPYQLPEQGFSSLEKLDREGMSHAMETWNSEDEKEQLDRARLRKRQRRKCCLWTCCCLLTFILLIGIVILVLFLKVKKPTVTFDGLTDQAGSTEPALMLTAPNVTFNVGLKINVSNPNFFGANIDSATTILYYPQTSGSIGGGTLSNLAFPKDSNTTIVFPITLSLPITSNVTTDILSRCLNGSDITIDYEVDLKVKIIVISIPVTLHESTSVPCPFSDFETATGLTNLSASELQGAAAGLASVLGNVSSADLSSLGSAGLSGLNSTALSGLNSTNLSGLGSTVSSLLNNTNYTGLR